MRTLAMSIFSPKDDFSNSSNRALDNEKIHVDGSTWPAVLQAVYDYLYIVKYKGDTILDRKDSVNDYDRLVKFMIVISKELPAAEGSILWRKELRSNALWISQARNIYEKNNIWNGCAKDFLFQCFPIHNKKFQDIKNGSYQNDPIYKICMHRIEKKLK